MLILYRVYQFLIMIPLMVILTLLAVVVTLTGCMLGGGYWWGYYPAKIWARAFCLLTFVKVTVHGRENITPGKSYVFVANHQGAYDIFSIYGYLNHNFRWMMKRGLRSIPFVGYTCKIAKHIYVDNSSPAATRATMAHAEKVLSLGLSIVVFPEGARTYTGKMRNFKRGAFMLADEFNLPVVPITIDGSFAVLPRTKRLPKWGHITLTIHKPLLPEEGKGHDLKELAAQSQSIIQSALAD